MTRNTTYNVPNNVLSDQGFKTAALYEQDSQENQQLLATVGLKAALFTRAKKDAQRVSDLEHGQEQLKADAGQQQAEVSQAVKDLIAWRNEKVIPRAKVVFAEKPELRHFRLGKLRSYRPAAVDREARLLIDAVRRFCFLPQAVECGLNSQLADKGAELLEHVRTQDSEAVIADAERSEATAELREAEVALSATLAEIEQRAAIVFDRGSIELRRYRMNEIRNYVARQNGEGPEVVDPTASVEVPDPDPSVATDLDQ